MKRSAFLSTLVISACPLTSSAITIQVDFGATGAPEINGASTEGGTTWNAVEPGANGVNLNGDGSFGDGVTTGVLTSGSYTANDLVDSTNAATNVDITLTWTTAPAADFNRAWDLHPGDRDGDYLGVRGDSTGVFNSITFSSLANGLYNITVWTNDTTDFRVDGGTVQNVSGATNTSIVNAAASHTFTNIAVTDGDVVIDWGHITTTPLANDWATITAISISDVPEPGSIALLGLGALGMLRRRRL